MPKIGDIGFFLLSIVYVYTDRAMTRKDLARDVGLFFGEALNQKWEDDGSDFESDESYSKRLEEKLNEWCHLD
ncbi:MAG: hypothetical protein AAF546_05080 [Verrucomicrobiota bacterium]